MVATRHLLRNATSFRLEFPQAQLDALRRRLVETRCLERDRGRDEDPVLAARVGRHRMHDLDARLDQRRDDPTEVGRGR